MNMLKLVYEPIQPNKDILNTVSLTLSDLVAVEKSRPVPSKNSENSGLNLEPCFPLLNFTLLNTHTHTQVGKHQESLMTQTDSRCKQSLRKEGLIMAEEPGVGGPSEMAL